LGDKDNKWSKQYAAFYPSTRLEHDQAMVFNMLEMIIATLLEGVGKSWRAFMDAAWWVLIAKTSPVFRSHVSEHIMNLTDDTSTLLLAAKIHGADWAVKVTANRRPRSLACSKRAAIYVVMDHRGTMKFIARLTGHLD
jgi:hypothetical protein